jgi:hypothetical protein
MSEGDWDSKWAMAANSAVGVVKAESSDEHFERTVERVGCENGHDRHNGDEAAFM